MLIEELQGKSLDEFFKGILSLETIEECYAFFDDLCTVNEIKTMVQRFQVAKMLYNHNTYSEIEAEANASTATISRVKRSLNHGNHSYELMFARMKEQADKGSK
ncbi:YerC/YecD family TrpR-related protein [Paenibacillus alvei]|uniref:YerC/YecD family TrpR-related protein n=1 Tax=Paenibacillus alvei TaxID=44250 RepID=A0ABT4GWF5_PAEAL|nr:YerC/YecD family TrpR-related protein [Paenibacillus alvei]EJW20000.1 TrpR like protein [Paenibacillus alvei DSM 29]MCY9543413.1 YerC/YecD family TrpR-related protein [Paenibacillus alvei]MCY9707600.1 YerC/YecD family TrpR-related protein [Paenibacillus alvei]MCY9733740.1 YerC/YecD family TrpR-related protein [Paenibacillus alvei]MCY9755469.1 YerC/YecD family TrpR-related protein [Paenibacillus alvei]